MKKRADSKPDPESKSGSEKLHYEPNPKHKDPWQPGRRGSLCPKEVTLKDAATMLKSSKVSGKKRYGVKDGRPYEAQLHQGNKWHGYPVSWVEVPSSIRHQLVAENAVSKAQLKRYW